MCTGDEVSQVLMHEVVISREIEIAISPQYLCAGPGHNGQGAGSESRVSDEHRPKGELAPVQSKLRGIEDGLDSPVVQDSDKEIR